MKFEKCNVLVDYINQSRKPTKAKVANIWLQRDGILLFICVLFVSFCFSFVYDDLEFANIILVIGEQKSQRQTFKVLE